MLAEVKVKRERAFSKADLSRSGQHRLRGVGIDEGISNAAAAPFAIYPFSPSTCARLTCNLLSFESVIGWDRLAGEFVRRGYTTHCPLPDTNEKMHPGQDVLVARRGSQGVTIHNGSLHQILVELVEPGHYVEATIEFLEQVGKSGSGMFTFANERAVWR